MWQITGANILGALVLGLVFGFAFAVGSRITSALFGPAK
jgi:hypothetical protein